MLAVSGVHALVAGGDPLNQWKQAVSVVFVVLGGFDCA